MNLYDLAFQLQDMRQRVALLQRQSEKQQVHKDMELVTAVFQELHLALEELQIAHEDLQQQNEKLSNAQYALIVQRQRYQELFEQASDAYFVTNTKGLIQEANAAAATLLNIPKNFLLEQPLEAFVVGKELITFRQKLTLIGDSPEIQEWEIILRPRNRTPIITAVKMATICNQKNKLVGLRWSLRDITESKRTEAKLRWAEAAMQQALVKEKELNELKSRLLNTTSHAFNTPLTAMLSCVESQENDRHQWSHEQQLTHVVLNQDETGELEFNPTLLNLVEFCHNLLAELEQDDNSQHAIAFISEYPSIQAYLDTKLLQHILSNLCSNCFKYSPLGSTVKFSVATQNDKAIFQIQDFGIGIPSLEIEHIFKLFYRASNVGNIPGIGLGMSIVKKAVDLHGGEITVESSLKEGTIFTVILPLTLNLHI
ncbi:ATP-binding protein [Nostoc sp. UHCC 0302]|uniref:PAS domain-containing sensor histidine kinase n=1 Tax=Nostoc sp. UHCC 0302 TaxID=3134896 RepID=UPI00311CC9F7